MMKNRVIAIDFDDVIIDTTPYMQELYNKKFGTKMQLKDNFTGDLEAHGAPDIATIISRVEDVLNMDEMRTISPLKDTISIIKQLAEHHRLYVVTGRSPILETATTNFINEYFPDVFQSIVFASYLRKGKSRTKSRICKKLGADLLIEDHLGHALEAAEGGTEVLLFGDYPWNQSENLPNNITRVKNWEEVSRVLLQIQRPNAI